MKPLTEGQPDIPESNSALMTAVEEAFLMGLIGSGDALLRGHAEVHRELGIRSRCYGKWVDEGKLSPLQAKEQYSRLEYAEKLLKKILDLLPKADDTPF